MEDHTLTWEEEEEVLHPCCLVQRNQDDRPFSKPDDEGKKLLKSTKSNVMAS